MVDSSLSDNAEIVMGQSPPGDTCNITGNGLPLLNGPTEYGAHHPVPVQFTTDARKRARKGDLLFCVRGSTTGRMNWADREYAIGRGVAAIRHRTKAELQPFVRAVVEYSLSDLLAQATGSTFPNVSADQLARLWWPPLEENEQCVIAHILGTLDDKIELNRRMNETLETMARTLFKSWFVDFDPVRAKADGRDPGLPRSLADLFPDTFEDSKLGEIPKGWAVQPLSELTTLITKGTTPTQANISADDLSDNGINYVRVNAIDENGAVLFEKLTKIPESVHSGVLKRSVLQADDVLYTIAGTIGRTAIVDESLLPANTNQAVAIIRSKETIPAAYLLMTLRAAAFREELHSNIVHAVQANLSLGVLSRARVVVPHKDTFSQLFQTIAGLTRRIASIRAESRNLTAIRKTLLPRLISGQIRVRGD